MELIHTYITKQEIQHSESVVYFQSRLNHLVKGIDEADHLYFWTKFVHCLCLCYNFYKCSKLNESWTMIETCGRLINKMATLDKSYADIIDGLRYVISVCKIGMFQTATKVLEKKTGSLKTAVISGTVAIFLSILFPLTAEKDSIFLSNRAVKLNSKNEVWYFVRAQCLRRSRCQTELHLRNWKDSLEEMINLSKRPWPMVYAADEYCIVARRIAISSQSECDALYVRSKALYEKAAMLCEDSVFIMSRVVMGCVYLPAQYKNKKLIKKCVQKLSSLPSKTALSYFALGVYHEHIKRVDSALDFYQKSYKLGFKQAAVAVIKLKNCTEHAYVPTEDMLQLVKFAPKDVFFQMEIFCQLTSYEFYVKRNLRKALSYWCQAMDICSLCETMKHHFSWFSNVKNENLWTVMREAARKEFWQNCRSYTGQDLVILLKVCNFDNLNFPRKVPQIPSAKHGKRKKPKCRSEKRTSKLIPKQNNSSNKTWAAVMGLSMKGTDKACLTLCYSEEQFEELKKWQNYNKWMVDRKGRRKRYQINNCPKGEVQFKKQTLEATAKAKKKYWYLTVGKCRYSQLVNKQLTWSSWKPKLVRRVPHYKRRSLHFNKRQKCTLYDYVDHAFQLHIKQCSMFS